MTDGFSRDSFARAMVAALQEERVLADAAGEVRFRPTERLLGMTIDPEALVWRTGLQITQSSLLIDDQVMITLVRRGRPGPHPGIAMMRHLTQRGFAASAPFLGDVVRVGTDGSERVLAIAQGFLRNQGNGWDWLLAQLRRMFDEALVADPPLPVPDLLENAAAPALGFLQALGRRLGEMHALLAAPDGDAAFAAAPVTEAMLKNWCTEAEAALEAAFEALSQSRASLDTPVAEKAEALLLRRRALAARMRRVPRPARSGLAVRVHGALRLHQTLVASGDAAIVGFGLVVAAEDGLAAAHTSPARDLATLVADLEAVLAAALQELPPPRAGAEDPRPGLAAAWAEAARTALLAGYRDGAAGSACIPAAPRDADRLLLLFSAAEAASLLAAAVEAGDVITAAARIEALLRIADADQGA